MTDWTAMDNPAVFDSSLWSARERKFAAVAGDTMFPDLLPPPSRKPKPAPAAEPMPGEQALFPAEELTPDA